MGFEKWITGALGWALFGPIGGILGFYFASKLEKMSAAVSAQGGQQAWNQGQRNSFLMSLLVLSASLSTWLILLRRLFLLRTSAIQASLITLGLSSVDSHREIMPPLNPPQVNGEEVRPKMRGKWREEGKVL